MAILIVLALMNIMAGIMLSASGLAYLQGNGFVVTIASVMLIKGAWFMITGLSGGRKPWEIFEGTIDIVGGLLLALVYMGMSLSLFALPGVLLIMTGSWYLFKGMIE